MADIKYYGRLVNKTDGHLADAEQIYKGSETVADILDNVSAELTAVNEKVNNIKIPEGSEIKITKLDTGDLNTIVNPGQYLITAAINTPDTFVKGSLEVIEKDKEITQTWKTEKGLSFRHGTVNEVDSSETTLTINNISQAPENGVIELSAGGTYTLNGRLQNAHIEITGTAPAGKTKVILDNVIIVSDTSEAIYYKPDSKSLWLELPNGTKNYIKCTAEKSAYNTDGDMGAVSSVNNLTVAGLGALTIISTSGNHGLRGSDVYIKGEPTLYIEAVHDGIHGGKLVEIEGGHFNINGVNDGVGTGDLGIINLYAGDFNITNCKQDEFDGKAGMFYYGLNSAPVNFVNKNDPNSFSTGSVWSATENPKGSEELYTKITELTPSESGVYTIDTPTTDTGTNLYYIVSGNLSDKTLFGNTGTTRIVLNNAYVKNITYNSPDDKSIKVKDIPGTVNYIVNANGQAIQSGSNIDINTDGVLFIKAKENAVAGSNLVIRGDGAKYIYADGGDYSLQGTNVCLGADSSDVAAGIAGNTDGYLYCGRIYARLNSKKTKKGTIFTYDQTVGDIIADSASAEHPNSKTWDDFTLKKPIYLRAPITGDRTAELVKTVVPVNVSEISKFPVDTVSRSFDGKWNTLYDSADYATTEEVKTIVKENGSIKVYESQDEVDAILDTLDLGTSMIIQDSPTENYTKNYSLYTVVLSGDKKILKKQEGGGSSGESTVQLEVNAVEIDGERFTDFTNPLDAKLDSTIKFIYSFTSDNDQLPGTVYLRTGADTLLQEKQYPDANKTYTATYKVNNLAANTYTFVMYGIDSAKKQSARVRVQIAIGGLAVEAINFNQDEVLTTNAPLNIDIKVSAADQDAKITAEMTIDTITKITKAVRPNADKETLTYEAGLAEGTHTIIIKLVNSKGKESNTLVFNVIAADLGKVYILSDSMEYEIADGALLSIPIRAIEVGYENSNFVLECSATYNGEVYKINGNEKNTYSLKYGRNVISILGFNHNSIDAEKSVYKLNLRLFSPSNPDNYKDLILTVNVVENDYNIEPTKDGLVFWFQSKGKSNSSEDRNTWLDGSGNGVSATLHNFNWESNGWLEDNDGNTALTLNSGAYVEIDYAPFFCGDKSIKDNDIQELTLSIDFSTKDILDSEAKVVSCLNEFTGTNTVIYYLRDAWGDYIKNDTLKNDYTTDFLVETIDSSTGKDIVSYDHVITAAELAENDELKQKFQKELGNTALDGDELIKMYIARKDQTLNNIVKYFIFAGGYCWLNGKNYNAVGAIEYGNGEDDELRYDVTYSPSERTMNMNLGAEIPEAERPEGSYLTHTGKTEEVVTKNTGFYIDTQYAILSNSSSAVDPEDKFHLYFSEDTRTRIDLIITRKNEQDPYYFPAMIGYTNGTLSLMQQLSVNDKFIQDDPEEKKFRIYLGCKATYDENGNLVIGNTGSAKIYSIRLYNKALEPMEVLRNYAAEIPDESKKKFVIDNNDLLGKGTMGKLPQICLIGAELNNKSTIQDFIMQLSNVDASHISELKAIKEPAYVTYIDPATGEQWERSITDPATGVVTKDPIIPVRLQFQGTSSMVYPVKNYKFKMYQDDFQEINGKVVYGAASDGKKFKVNIGNGFDESTICLKADYMDSSHCNNTGCAMFISDYNELSGKTPASKINSAVRTTIYGYPVLLYYKNSKSDTTQHFLGVYNCNIDKSCTTSFGFEKIKDDAGVKFNPGQAFFLDDEFSKDILVKSNETIRLKDSDGIEKDYVALKNPSGTTVAAMSEKGYLRSITNDEVEAIGCFEFKANSGNTGAGGFGNYGIISTAADLEGRYPDEGDIEDDFYAPYADANPNGLSFDMFMSPWFYHIQRMIKWVKTSTDKEFVDDIDKHFNRNYLLDYFLTIMLLGGVDSLGKNLMMATWGPENRLFLTTADDTSGRMFEYDDNGTTLYLTDEVVKTTIIKNGKETQGYNYAKNAEGKYLFYNENSYNRYTRAFADGRAEKRFTAADVVLTPGESIWYPIFYDIDTVCGLDNSGQLIYDVDIEIGDQLSDGTAVFNTSDSYLWSRMNTIYRNNGWLAERWKTLRDSKKFSLDNLVGKFFYTNQIAKIPEKYYNDDCLIKYIWEGPFKPGELMDDGITHARPGSGSYLYCIHGSRYEQIKHWYGQRLIYIDTMFGLFGAGNSSLRFNYNSYDANYGGTMDWYKNKAELAREHPEAYIYKNNKLYSTTNIEIIPIEFNFKTYQPCYVGVKWFNGGTVLMQRVHRNETAVLEGNVKTAGDAEVFVYGDVNIKDVGNLAPYNVKQIDFKTLTKLSRLVIGDSEHSCVINKLDLGTNTYLSYLQLTNCSSLTSIDVSKCENIKEIEMTGSRIMTATLPSGGALERIAYSSAITNINLNNFVNLSSVSAESLNNLTSLRIYNCPKILGTPTSQTGTIWNLLQETYATGALNNIEVTGYGVAEPKKISATDYYFFLDKYCSISTSKNVKGELTYTGVAIPENYTKFKKAYPELKINYKNILDASGMFENYKNLNCISSMRVYTGTDIYGNKKYTSVYYWTDSRYNDFKDEYGEETQYTSNKKFYYSNGVHYRMLGIYDKSDMDGLRAEIKEHVSDFKRFTNLNKMFKGMTILDYLDPDTFNDIDISEATTDEMFFGCTSLEYFELPNDNLKNKPVYKVDEEGLITTEIDHYENPITGEVEAGATGTYKKGMRRFGKNMFYGCTDAVVYINNEFVNSDKVIIDPEAFAYNIAKKSGEAPYMRPVILFKNTEEQLIGTETDPDTKLSYRVLKANDYIRCDDTKWLREVYCGINTVNNINYFETGANAFYAESTIGSSVARVIFKAKTQNFNNDTSSNNLPNLLSVISVKTNAFTKLIATWDRDTKLEFALPQFICLSKDYPLMDEEYSAYSLFTDKTFTIGDAKFTLPGENNSMTFSIVNTLEIPNQAFRGFKDLVSVSITNKLTKIGDYAFADCTKLETFNYYVRKGGKGTLGPSNTTSSRLYSIGAHAFENCSSLQSFYVPYPAADDFTEYPRDDEKTNKTILGDSVFRNCTKLSKVSFVNSSKGYKSPITEIPPGFCANCTSLLGVEQIPVDITSIGNEAFYNCSAMSMYKQKPADATGDYQYKDLSFISESGNFDVFTNLKSIGDYAFYRVLDVINRARVITGADNIPIHYTTLLKFNSAIEYIGSSAFFMVDTIPATGFTEIAWDGNYSTGFTSLIIGGGAFAGIRTSWRLTDGAEPIEDCIGLPKVLMLGENVFQAANNQQFNYALIKNDTSIGSRWISGAKKIIYQYYGVYQSTITQDGHDYDYYFYLLSENGKDETYTGGTAYIQNLGTMLGSLQIPTSVEYDGKLFKIIQILSGAFSICGDRLSSLRFDADSKIELIESKVLQSSSLSSIQTGETMNKIPDTLKIETDNNFSKWLEVVEASMETSGFITLGNNIMGYKEPVDWDGNIDLNDSTIANCDTVFDNAFNGKNLISIVFNNNIKYIHKGAFGGTKLSGTLKLPNGILEIAEAAFKGCSFSSLHFPKSLRLIGSDAFGDVVGNENNIYLTSVDFEDGIKISGDPFKVATEYKTNALQSELPQNVNITLKEMHIPNGMGYLLRSEFSQSKMLSQLTKIYPGELKVNDITGDKNYGTYLCRNIPLYKNKNGDIFYFKDSNGKAIYNGTETPGSDDTPYVNDDGKQVYCELFYYYMAQKTKGYKDNILETTEEYSVCPLGDYTDADGIKHDGFSESIDLSYIRFYNMATPAYSGDDGLSRTDLLRILAGYTSSLSKDTATITIRSADQRKIYTDMSLINQINDVGLNISWQAVII